MISLTVDGREISAREGHNLLTTCLQHGIYIPHLCFMDDMVDPPASCRLCFVDIEGMPFPVASCRVHPAPGMVVKTDTERVRRLQRSALRLLLSVHRVDCRNCPSNTKCVLQDLGKFLGIPLKSKKLEHLEREITIDLTHPLFEFNPHRCILCGKCIYVCQQRNGTGLLTFAKRGFATVVACFGDHDLNRSSCQDCHACVEVCPVSAIFLKSTPS